MEGTSRLARNLNVKPEHGLIEVIQNADDLGATVVRFVFVPGPPRRLLVVHDGDRVRAPHVLAMTLALVSTKGDDAFATGKFGIGLKTLTRLASKFEIHSPPYDFRVADQRLAPASAHERLPATWDPERPETLLALAVNSEYPNDGLRTSFKAFAPDSLLFLRSVRRLELRAPNGDLLRKHELVNKGARHVALPIGDDSVSAISHRLHEPATGRTWVRLEVERPICPKASSGRTSGRRVARHLPSLIQTIPHIGSCTPVCLSRSVQSSPSTPMHNSTLKNLAYHHGPRALERVGHRRAWRSCCSGGALPSLR